MAVVRPLIVTKCSMAWFGPVKSARVPIASLEAATAEIEQIVQNSLEREVKSDFIGQLVMERLKPLDEVSYVRFASVYRQFKDINSFMNELNKILAEK